jgi:hypothetical protein
MDTSTLIYGGLLVLAGGYWLLSRQGETANQEIPIPVPVEDRAVSERRR